MKYEWDENKNHANFTKHGIDFSTAEEVLSGELITVEDERKNYGERRFISFGSLRNRMIVVVYTYRKDIIRIISMRKANEKEQRCYKEYFRKT